MYNSVFFSVAQHSIPPDQHENATADLALKKRMGRGYAIVIVLSLYLGILALFNDDLSDNARYVRPLPFIPSIYPSLLMFLSHSHYGTY